MAVSDLLGRAQASGLINEEITPLEDEVIVQFVEGLTMEKSADRASWAMGELTYTIRIVNQSDVDYTDVEVFDLLDFEKVHFVVGSARMGETTLTPEYNSETGLLTFFPQQEERLTITTGSTVEITFRIDRNTP